MPARSAPGRHGGTRRAPWFAGILPLAGFGPGDPTTARVKLGRQRRTRIGRATAALRRGAARAIGVVWHGAEDTYEPLDILGYLRFCQRSLAVDF